MKLAALGPRPEKPLELYEYEACPFCRRVRLAISLLDLEAIIYPCPRGGQRHRAQVIERGGKEQFPFLCDPNTGVAMYESADIVRYLVDRYGAGELPGAIGGEPPACGLSRALPSRAPAAPLELWSYEASDACVQVRDVLCAYELPYLLHSAADGSVRRDELARRTGSGEVPYLVDPNTGAALGGAAAIAEYLEARYAA
jgi:glutathione S-transferase